MIKVDANFFFSVNLLCQISQGKKGLSWAVGIFKGMDISSGHGHSCSHSVSIQWAVSSSPSWIFNRIFTQCRSLVDVYLQDWHTYLLQASSFRSNPNLFISLQTLSILLSINTFYCHKTECSPWIWLATLVLNQHFHRIFLRLHTLYFTQVAGLIL